MWFLGFWLRQHWGERRGEGGLRSMGDPAHKALLTSPLSPSSLLVILSSISLQLLTPVIMPHNLKVVSPVFPIHSLWYLNSNNSSIS